MNDRMQIVARGPLGDEHPQLTYVLRQHMTSDFRWWVEVRRDGVGEIATELACTRWGAMRAARRVARRYAKRQRLIGGAS